MPAGNTVIKIPIQAELQNSQAIIQNLREVMSKIKPDSRGFTEIISLLDQAERKLENIYERSSHGIIDKRGLSQIEHGFEDALTSIEQAARRIQGFNFNNITLTPEQTKQFTEISEKIEEARTSYQNLQKIKLTNLAKDSKELQENFSKVGINFDEDDIESALKKVDDAIKKTSKDIDDLLRKQKQAFAEASVKTTEVEELERLRGAFSRLAADRSKFSEFFNYKGYFKAGGKEKFIEELTKYIGLDSESAEIIRRTSASELYKLREFFEKDLERESNKRRSKLSELNSKTKVQGEQILEGQSDLKGLENLRKNISGLKADPELKNALTDLTERITQLEQENENLKRSMADDATQGAKKGFQEAEEAADKARVKFEGVTEELNNFNQSQRNMESIKFAITNFLGFNQVLNLVRNGIRNAINHIKELDTTMNGIAIVTNMTTADLWKQVDAYSQMAQKFGVTIQGAYEVSKIYYQAGYDTNEVLTLTNETLKLSKISGLDYATTTDYMMTAMRGFKMEMEDASRVVDVYSNLAANTAVSQQELAEAMTRTASSMESVGATFEETSAMIATMVAVTRESANNIGSALKSIASR